MRKHRNEHRAWVQVSTGYRSVRARLPARRSAALFARSESWNTCNNNTYLDQKKVGEHE